MFININPKPGKPEGSYFGISVTDGYDVHQCYSWAWECMTYWGTEKDGRSQSVYKALPDIDWRDDDEEKAASQQIIAICEKIAERPEKRFFFKTVIVEEEAKTR